MPHVIIGIPLRNWTTLPRKPKTIIMTHTNITLLDANAIADYQLRENMCPTKSQISIINAVRLITKIIKSANGTSQGIRIKTEGKNIIGNVTTVRRQN